MKISEYPTVLAGGKSYHMKISKPASITAYNYSLTTKKFPRFGGKYV